MKPNLFKRKAELLRRLASIPELNEIQRELAQIEKEEQQYKMIQERNEKELAALGAYILSKAEAGFSEVNVRSGDTIFPVEAWKDRQQFLESYFSLNFSFKSYDSDYRDDNRTWWNMKVTW
jgi:hypothetical protein